MPRRSSSFVALLPALAAASLAVSGLMGCSSSQPSPASSSGAVPTAEAPPVPSTPPPAPSMAASSAAPGEAPAAPASSTAPAASAAPSAETEPAVDVKNIGMHVGGGVNDASEKAPIKRSVEPHMSDFAKCFAKAEDPTKGGDLSIDLRIEREGGKAQVKAPKTSIKGADFKACATAVFEGVDFEKPKGGTTVVSYSLRFTPKKK